MQNLGEKPAGKQAVIRRAFQLISSVSSDYILLLSQHTKKTQIRTPILAEPFYCDYTLTTVTIET
jgi:hypothetical protein